MMLKVDKGGYYVGIWFLAGDHQDWLAIVARDRRGFFLTYRFRYYAEKRGEALDPFNAKDEKTWYRCTMVSKSTGEALSEDETIALVDGMAALMVDAGYLRPDADVQRILVRGDGEAFRRAMVNAPFAHVQTAFVCPRCNLETQNLMHVANGWCPRCKQRTAVADPDAVGD